MTAPTRNQFDFLAFLDQLEREISAGQQVIAILDNLSTHKTPNVQAWSRGTHAGRGLHAKQLLDGEGRVRYATLAPSYAGELAELETVAGGLRG